MVPIIAAGLYLSLLVLVYFLIIIGHLTLITLFKGIGQSILAMKVSLVNFLILIVLSPILAFIHGVIGAIVA
jgi:Na+-driven multidrug efflux pump